MKKTLLLTVALVLAVLAMAGALWLAIGQNMMRTRQIVGTWEGMRPAQGGNPKHSIVMEIAEDRTINVQVSSVVKGQTQLESLTGTWRMDGGRFKCLFTSGYTMRETNDKIITFSKDMFVIERGTGVATMRRVPSRDAARTEEEGGKEEGGSPRM